MSHDATEDRVTNEVVRNALDKIDGRQLLEDTYSFVSIPSPTGEEEAFSNVYASRLGDLGMDVEMDREWPDSPSIVAWWRNPDGGPVLQLDGHTDTITVPHRPPGIERDRGIVRGRGAADMKGGLAAILHAVQALRQSPVRLHGSVLVTAHGLHEAPGGDQRTLRSLLRRGVAGDAALVAELSKDALPIAAKGMSIFRITVGREGGVMHEAELARRQSNPMHGLKLLLDGLDRKAAELEAITSPLVGRESLFIGEVHGGDFYNRVPARVEIVGTRRYALPHTAKDVAEEFEALCADLARQTGLSLAVSIQDVGAPYALAGTEPVVKAVQRGYFLATGADLPLVGAEAVGNAADFVAHGIPAVYHGVDQSTAHSDAEFVTAGDLVRAARVYAASILEFCGYSAAR